MFNNSTNRFDLKFGNNSTLIKLIYANVAVLLGIKLLLLPFWLMNMSYSADQFALNWLATPANLGQLLIRPWTVITYMFLHLEFGHLFFNMLILFLLGRIFVEFLGSKKLWSVYVAGGIAGAVLYILFFNLFPVFDNILPSSKALGASAAVMAIVVAIGTYIPDFEVRPLNLFSIKLKYIALFLFIIDVINISNSNSGGRIAHIGGAILGFSFAQQWKKGKDITAWVDYVSNYILALLKPRKSKLKVKYKKESPNRASKSNQKQANQAEIDAILDKISQSGYDSLSKKEKEILFKASNKS